MDKGFPALQWQRLQVSEEFKEYLSLLAKDKANAEVLLRGIKSGTPEEIAIKTVTLNTKISTLESALTLVDKKIKTARAEREEAEQTAGQRISRLAAMRWR